MQKIAQSREFTKKEIYNFICPQTQSINKIDDGKEISVTGYFYYSSEDRDGEEISLLSLETPEGYYVTSSSTFYENFMLIWDMLECDKDNPAEIIKTTGKSKSGRVYQDCIFNDK